MFVGAVIIYAFYKWATINNDYFKRRGVKSMKPTLILGNSKNIILSKVSAADVSKNLYKEFPTESIYGRFDFRSPVYVLRNPDSVKQIAVKDFEYFEDHQAIVDIDLEKIFGNSLIMLKGAKWRDMRSTLSPAFTGSKMRLMFDLVTECASEYVNYFKEEIKSGKRVNVEVKDLFSRYTNDVIATSAFGLKTNSLKNPNNEFFANGRKMMDISGIIPVIKMIVINQLPKLARAINLQFFDKKVTDLFKSMILDTMDIRAKQNIQRPDMINILMQVREGSFKRQAEETSVESFDGFATVEESDVGKKAVNRVWDDNEIVVQCFLFFAAGFDTASTLLTFASYELVANPDIQQRLYEEIVETNKNLGGKQVDYDTLQKMKYLDQVVCESLRKWPPAPQLDRLCVRDYVYNDGENHKFQIEKGRILFIPVYGFHHDAKYFPNPEKFDPDRVSDENKDSIVPGSYMPFGVGPRNCIGSRFALMEIKAILYNLLLNFSFEANQKKLKFQLNFERVHFY